VPIEEYFEGIVSLAWKLESSSVRTISIVSSHNINSSLGLYYEIITSECLVVSVLVSCLDGKGELREASGVEVCA